MKDAAKKTYGKKGDAVVQKNWDAIDIGHFRLCRKSRYPRSGPNATDRRRGCQGDGHHRVL